MTSAFRTSCRQRRLNHWLFDLRQLLAVWPDGQPPVRQLAGQLEVAAPQRCHVHRNLLLHGRNPHSEPLQVVKPAFVIDPPAGQRQAHDVHVLSCARHRMVERYPVPVLNDDAPAAAQPQYGPSPADAVQRRDALRDQPRGTAVHGNDARPQPDAFGVASEHGQHREGVATPGFAGPEGVITQPVGGLGYGNQVGVVVVVAATEGQSDGLHMRNDPEFRISRPEFGASVLPT